MRKNATPTNETAKKTQREFGTKALRRDGVQTSTPGGGMALSLMLRVRGAAECGAWCIAQPGFYTENMTTVQCFVSGMTVVNVLNQLTC
ncbi:MAG: hypothetical protein ACRYGK_04165 [Janthinobacterium lividum]